MTWNKVIHRKTKKLWITSSEKSRYVEIVQKPSSGFCTNFIQKNEAKKSEHPRLLCRFDYHKMTYFVNPRVGARWFLVFSEICASKKQEDSMSWPVQHVSISINRT